MTVSIKPSVFAYYFIMFLSVAVAVFFVVRDNAANTVAVSTGSSFVLIIDPGHGGADGGAVSITGNSESAINLDISLKMRALAQLTATPCLMTRESEHIEYPESAGSISKKKVYDQKQRVAFIDSIPGAIVISIHQNKFPSGSPRGPQAFYAIDESSVLLASIAQENLNAALYPGNRRVASPISDNIFLFKKIGCPALLAECGFLSNPEEARLLEDDAYQLKTALALMSAYYKFLSSEPIHT